ncbi:sugar O-acetyltransferase [Vibrio aestuarianus]|uniref:Nodulation protein L n=1 Tax=Vibrio aestuarianus TaxID=28171 RepID=A0A9X4IZ80_9VIBR|nr:sugar O-acetyltransferase [Vibrio aestuarianus]MDE1213492.1 sugar O-acetyltransferase [Vibrio aestuarianus]MDE1219152.1 sugar O-acetyltransferase [Vibrio aestuarianus]MDE1222291.1 sugar O-acetyltransferase [Vibrio aestuarianus]MDE1229571.1 sugar O-acetyltransferase [Vibrio aestuarianus]MDE1230177.1 sugar O-acetyltransferase [Vibrio aestuarianus]
MTEMEKMMDGQIFDGADPEIDRIRCKAAQLQIQINQCCDASQRYSLQQQLFGVIGHSVVQPPFHCEFGETIHIGDETFINMNVTMLDGACITIGNHVLIGPNTQFYTPSHSLDYRSRRLWETFCKPIVVEDDVWIGGNVIVNQGVTIGARSVVAANSVVNQDVPPDTLVGGTPARVIRSLKEVSSLSTS